jgi:Fe-S cluster biogenesis protein NfuA
MDNKITLDRAKDFIETEIRPLIQGDGGDIEVLSLKSDGTLIVKLQGACANCASQAMTLAFGIETRIKEAIPEITSVEQG